MVGGVDLLRQRGVQRGHGVGERRRDDQVDVDAFAIHVASRPSALRSLTPGSYGGRGLLTLPLSGLLPPRVGRGIRRRLTHLALVRQRLDAQVVATVGDCGW